MRNDEEGRAALREALKEKLKQRHSVSFPVNVGIRNVSVDRESGMISMDIAVPRTPRNVAIKQAAESDNADS